MPQERPENSYSVDLTLRNHPPIESFVVQWDYPVMVRRNDLNARRLRQSGRDPQYSPDMLLRVLEEHCDGRRSGEWKRECQSRYRMSSSTFYDLKRRLEAKSKVILVDGVYLAVQPLLVEQDVENDESSPETPETVN